MFQCYKCKTEPVEDEYMRCPACEAEHRKLCAELDARPKKIVEKAREELYPIVEYKQGVKVTTYITKEEAAILGIKL